MGEQCLHVDGLAEECKCSAFHRLGFSTSIKIRCDENDRRPLMKSACNIQRLNEVRPLTQWPAFSN